MGSINKLRVVLNGFALGGVLFAGAGLASAGPVTVSTTAAIAAIPETSSIIGTPIFSGNLSPSNQGSVVVSGEGSASASGSAAYVSALNGMAGSVAVSSSATASASSATSAFSLGTQATATATNVVAGTYGATATASYGDLLDMSGVTAGSLYTFDMGFFLDGNTSIVGSGSAFVDVFVGLTDAIGGTYSWLGRFRDDAVISTAAAGGSVAPLTFRYSGLGPLSLGVTLRAVADPASGNPLNIVPGSAFTNDADFFHTLTLTHANIIGPGGVVIAVTNSSGLTFNDVIPAAPTAAPEPATLLLIGSGLVAAWRRRPSV